MIAKFESFEDLGLSIDVLRAVREIGYSSPTPIQEKSIPLVLMGRDVLGCAQTGTGKTASFSLPIIDILSQGSSKARMPRSLILSPTRELAQQTSDNFNSYCKFNDLTQALLIGGESLPDQERSLLQNPDIVIATPGRLIDMFERGRLMLGGIKILVIDEADRMLDMGFIPDVKKIVSSLPRIRQTLLFSATLGSEVRELADSFLINPKEISVDPESSIAQTVKHMMVSVSSLPKEKRAALRQLVIAQANLNSAIIFCNRKKDISILCNSLKKRGFNAEELHGDMNQHDRTQTLAAYKNGFTKYLICSDVAGRGLDIDGVSHVFNFDVPTSAESYIHRIGRTGRAGKTGIAITLVTPEDEKYVKAIIKLIGMKIPVLSLKKIESENKDNLDRSRNNPVPVIDSQIPKKDQQSNFENPYNNSSSNISRARENAGKLDKTESKGAVKSNGNKKVIGMGDHLPDFLKDPTRYKG